MFGWRTPSDGDAAAVARRRLAAIAAQFAMRDEQDSGRTTDGADTVGGAEGSHNVVLDDVDDNAPSVRPGVGGRHAGKSQAAADGRWAMSAHHVAIIALIAVALLMVTAWLVLRSAPHSQPVQLSTVRSLPTTVSSLVAAPTTEGAPLDLTPSGGAPASATSTAGRVVVDVAGKVRHPGIVELPGGSRVVDALNAAGGARPGVDTRSVNLARLLVDGEQIVVGFDVPGMGGAPWAGATSASSSADAIQPVNLNTATAEQLDTLPGIGPVTAQAILTWRDQNGAFTSVDELLEVSGIGDATLADIAAYVYV